MEPPEKPDDADCCNSGCIPCIYDVYEEKLKKYNNQIPEDVSFYDNCISELKYSVFILKMIVKHSSDTYIYTFEYLNKDNNNFKLLYEPGQHFLMKAETYGDQYTRAYTPIPIKGLTTIQFAILVKIYEIGKMSKYLTKLKLNCDTLWRGPYGSYHINYTHKHILLISQGTGITPLFAIIHKLLENEECETVLKLFCCVRNDILLRDEIYDLSRNWNFSYEAFVGDGNDLEPKYNEVVHQCKLEAAFIEKYFNNLNSDQCFVMICGSEEFGVNTKRNITDLGILDESIHLF